jgi:lysophospholipase L1-like esterase
MNWYEDDVRALEQQKGNLPYDPKMVFYGSSSIRLWEGLYEDFEEYQPVNLGFGGSTLAACVWFFDRLVGMYHPESIIVYAGDNDLGDGRHPEEVFIFFQQLVVRMRERFGDIPLAFISIKPSIARWNIVDNIRYTNTLIAEEIARQGGNLHYIDLYDRMIDETGQPNADYLEPDGLHISPEGYTVWKEVVGNYIASSIHDQRIP